MLMRSKVKHWDLIELLIAHGGREGVGSRDGSKVSMVERTYISELLRTRPCKRPPRPCPCFSGRLLSDCHGKGARPFPHHFMCPCQSGSVYAKCCKKRKVSWRDIWNAEQGIIEPWRKDLPVYLPLSQDAATLLSRIRKVYRKPLPLTEILRRPTDVPLAVAQVGVPSEIERGNVAMLPVCLGALSRNGSVDPAFAFAMKMVRWHARPLGRKVPKNYATELARTFNKYVDEYIASARDSRNKLEIEIEAKLGSSCGALYRVCEADRCTEQEGRTSAKFKYCQECRMAVYCSVKCQRAHWNVHEDVCCASMRSSRKSFTNGRRNMLWLDSPDQEPGSRAISPTVSRGGARKVCCPAGH
ncbi:hypothetical protein BD410DRAFT_114075 [Rickenella mellea]|uniref:MYND-type domain-containing protein n=1 Tax=Rickenella mellea TaxID=50990 RepID=A0A4Y7QA33_9AGAM|nr:hypothetical protein BD410DRAFT_114075 [Rickenella mellea]